MVDNRILEDFNYDLEAGRNASWLSFSFRDLIIINEDFKDALFTQFQKLIPHPKYHWFAEGYLSEGYLTEDESNRWDNKHEQGVFYADVESKLSDLMIKFDKMVCEDLVEKKYYGRNLLSTPMVKVLNQIGSKFTEFEKYVSRENKESYQVYASAFASEVIALTDKLCIPDLKAAILNKFIDESGNTDIMLGAIMQYAHYNTDTLRSEYDVLKMYANKLLRDELLKAKPLSEAKISFNSFDEVFIDDEHKNKFYNYLQDYRLNNKSIFKPRTDFEIRNGSSSLLYQLIKGFKNNGCFKRITDTKLLVLVNRRFNTNTSYQHYKQQNAAKIT